MSVSALKAVRTLPYNQFINEQDFKVWVIAEINKSCPKAVFEIENEEKEPGFPDVLSIDTEDTARFYEIKVAYKGGRFVFEPTQPRFFKLHPDLNIKVVVWDKETHKVWVIPAKEAADKVLEKGSLTLNVREF